MIATPSQDLVLAFAGVFQSAALVSELARQDRFDEQALHESAYSLLRLDAESTEKIFGSTYSLDLGLRTVVKMFSSKPDIANRDIFQYSAAIYQLGIKLHRLNRIPEVIQAEIREIQFDYLDHYGDHEYNEKLYEELANLYSNTISQLSPRIIVQGDPDRLKEQQTVNRVRTALFAGIRSAFLWHQLGGRRWQLLFNRNKYVQISKRLVYS